MNFYVGTSGYSYKEWKGAFYPTDLPAQQMLHFYGEHFRAVEINHTFRVMPKESVLKGWASEVPVDFKFVLKAPMLITHRKRLKNVDDPLTQFLAASKTLKKRLGPLLFQLHPNMKKDLVRLREFLSLLPKRSRAAFEFRHASWFDEDVFDLLREHGVALCFAEAEGDLEVPFVATADWGYVRLRQPEYNTRQLRAWVKRIKAQQWQDAFVFFKHEDEGKGPQLARRFLELAA